MKTCPFCAEEIQATALLCEPCQRRYGRLCRAAGRLARLLEITEKKHTHDGDIATLDYLLGGIYALILAKKNGYRDRKKWRPQIDKIKIRAKQVSEAQVRTDGKWIAGFHFNSALTRIDAVYHRGLKIVMGVQRRKDVHELRVAAKGVYAGWTDDRVHHIHKEVIRLKHDRDGLFVGRKVPFRDAVRAVDELLKLFEAWVKRQGWVK